MAAVHDEPEEPDLTAMLDLVLQLVMFFIAVAHIEKEQQNQSVVLPQASLARSLTKDYTKVVIVNVVPAATDPDDAERMASDPNAPVKKVMYTVFEGYTNREYTDVGQLKDVFKNKFEADKKATPAADWEAGRGRSLVILRAHKNCNFKQVFGVLSAARGAGYTDIQLRANVAGVAPR